MPTKPSPLPVRPVLLAWLLAAPVLAAAQSEAPPPLPEGRPLWEAGVAVLGANGPDYPAAGTRRWRGAVAPVFVYRGSRLRVDDNGVRGRLLSTDRIELDLSAAAGFNARSNAVRRGMPDLDYTFELGPQAVYRVPLDHGQQVSAHLKARAVFSTDLSRIDGRGMVVEQEYRWTRRGWPHAASQVVGAAQFTWGSEKLHDYFYQVDPNQATSVRPAYDARAGYFGTALRGGIVHRLTPTLSVSAGASLNLHAGAANRDSPLFQKRSTAGVLFALVWMPVRSDESASP